MPNEARREALARVAAEGFKIFREFVEADTGRALMLGRNCRGAAAR